MGSGDVDCRTSACPNWILIRTWPAGSPGCASECIATFTGDSHMNSANVHHVMWDGGPDLKIRFNSNVAGTFSYVNDIDSDWHIVYRTQQFWQRQQQRRARLAGRRIDGCRSRLLHQQRVPQLRQHGRSGVGRVPRCAGGGGGYTDFVFQKHIVRDMYGEGLEINPRVTSSGAKNHWQRVSQCRQGHLRRRSQALSWDHDVDSERRRQSRDGHRRQPVLGHRSVVYL